MEVNEQQFQVTVCQKLADLLGLPLEDVDVQKPMTGNLGTTMRLTG